MPDHLINDHQMHYEVYGQGQAMVMIHGGLGGDEGCGSFVEHHASTLARQFKMIFYDRRASGSSSTPEDGYSMKNYSHDLSSLLTHLQVSNAHVLGQSGGGPIAMQFALDHPDMTDTLLLINTMSYASGSERAARQIELDQLLADGASVGKLESTVRALEIRRPGLREKEPARFQRLVEFKLERFEGIAKTIQSYLDIGDSLESRLSELEMPTLMVHGDADSRISIDCSYQLHNAISGSELYVVPGAEHGLLANEPELTRNVILRFLDKNAAQVSPV